MMNEDLFTLTREQANAAYASLHVISGQLLDEERHGLRGGLVDLLGALYKYVYCIEEDEE